MLKVRIYKWVFAWAVVFGACLVLPAGQSAVRAEPTSPEFPRVVHFRGKQETYNSRYDFTLRDSRIWYRPRNDTLAAWRPLKLHKSLACPQSLSVDSEVLVALNADLRIFTMIGVLQDDPDKARWYKTWGAPFRLGGCMKLPSYNEGWDLSYLSPREDRYYRAFTGGKYQVGQGVTNIFFLSREGQHITYLDPWLPNDVSYRVGTPHRGRFQSVGISSSGSTIFIINRYGDMYTITYDFDMAGADDFFFKYSYDPTDYAVEDTARILPRKIPRPLPLPGWTQQPKISGTITDRITVDKTPPGTFFRALLVEGSDSLGRTGYYAKDINEKAWRFVETGLPLQGNLLENSPQDRSCETLGPDESKAFHYTSGKIKMEIPDFHLYVPRSTLVLSIKDCLPCTLTLHTHETIRQFEREPGLTDQKILLRGAVELPGPLREKQTTLEKPVRAFLKEHLADRAFTEVKVWAAASYLQLIDPWDFKWHFTRLDKR